MTFWIIFFLIPIFSFLQRWNMEAACAGCQRRSASNSGDAGKPAGSTRRTGGTKIRGGRSASHRVRDEALMTARRGGKNNKLKKTALHSSSRIGAEELGQTDDNAEV